MRSVRGKLARGVSASLLAAALGISSAGVAGADETDAKNLLKAMSDYMASTEAFSFNFNSDLEVVTTEDQKLAFASSGTMAISRPDKVHATRTGGFADVEFIFDGTTVTLFGKSANVYAQASAPGSIDDLIDTLRDTYRRPIPGADLLTSDVYDTLMADVTDIKDLGSGVINGVECNHFAFRAPTVDWQIWIATGDEPYPCRFRIASKELTTSPQYTVDITDWKAGDAAGATDFTFKNTTDAREVDVANLPDLDELPEQYTPGEK